MIYIGATTKKYLCSRLAEHKHNYKLWKNKLITKCYSFDIFDKHIIRPMRVYKAYFADSCSRHY